MSPKLELFPSAEEAISNILEMWPKAFAIFSKHVRELARILACSQKELAFAALFPKRHPDHALYAIGKLHVARLPCQARRRPGMRVSRRRCLLGRSPRLSGGILPKPSRISKLAQHLRCIYVAREDLRVLGAAGELNGSLWMDVGSVLSEHRTPRSH